MDDAEIGRIAADKARQDTIAELNKDPRLNSKAFTKHLVELVNANLVKAKYDKDSGKWKYSKRLTDNKTRLGALKLLAELRDLMPATKHQVAGQNGEPISISFVTDFGTGK